MNKCISTLVLSILVMSIVGNAANMDTGKKIFDEKCKFCHREGSSAQGISALARDAKNSENIIRYIVKNGTISKNMSPVDMSDNDLEDLIVYLKSINSSADQGIQSGTPTTTSKQSHKINSTGTPDITGRQSPKITSINTPDITGRQPPKITSIDTPEKTTGKQTPVTPAKTSGFELAFGGLSILTIYILRRK